MGTGDSKSSDNRQLMKLAQVCKQLGLDRKTLLKLIHSGKLTALRVGSIWLIDRNDLKNYLESLRKQYESEYGTP